jgi:hypothetical protein
MGQEKVMQSHDKMNGGAEKGDFLGQEKLILGQYMTNYGTNKVSFWDRRS